MKNRMLVIGAAGFIGSHLCKRLLAEGYAVVGPDDLSGAIDEGLRRTVASFKAAVPTSSL